jgi:anaerobic selenocysteine-containing dehydrogenase
LGCGILIYSLGDGPMNARPSIIHIEDDPDHPVNRGTLCPKGSALLDVVHAPTRLNYPMYREPGTSAFKRVSWDFALDRSARLMKQDRDAKFSSRGTRQARQSVLSQSCAFFPAAHTMVGAGVGGPDNGRFQRQSF